MANSGGGVIVYGVKESAKAASERIDVGEISETHERALRSAAITAITPPVFGLKVHRLGAAGRHALAIEVPGSVDGPHLIFRNEYFGAPIRNDADTVWMKERQIEAMYRARFEQRRHATEALDGLFLEAADGRDTHERAWLIAVANPRLPRVYGKWTRDQARKILTDSGPLALKFAKRHAYATHPIENIDFHNPRPGLRRWVAANTATGERAIWREAWASIHHDGSVTLTTAIGGHMMGNGDYYGGNEIESSAIECAVADLMALVRTTAQAADTEEYEVRIGIAWKGEEPLRILSQDTMGFAFYDNSTPLTQFTPVEASVDASGSDADYLWQVHDIAQDCINQGGVSTVLLITPPERDGS